MEFQNLMILEFYCFLAEYFFSQAFLDSILTVNEVVNCLKRKALSAGQTLEDSYKYRNLQSIRYFGNCE